MAAITDQFSRAFRDFATDGVPASGLYDVEKTEVRALGPLIESAIATMGLGALLSARFATLAAANASLAYPDGAVAVVYADATDANNDLVVKSGSSGSGSWTVTTVLHDIIDALAAPFVTAAAASAASAIAAIDGNRLSNSIALISHARSFDANNLTIPYRDGRVGSMLDLNPAEPSYLQGAFKGPSSSALKCVRASTGGAIGGGGLQTSAVDAPRIIGGKIFRDVGGTNPVVGYADISNAQWTKSGLNAGAITSVAGEEGSSSAKRIPETNTGLAATHVLQNNVTIASSTDFFVGQIGNAERGYLQLDVYNSGTTAGVRARFDLTSNGALISPFPAVLGTGATNLAAGVVKLASGLFFYWVAGTMPSANTLLRIYTYQMSNSTTPSYIGDTSKALVIEKTWATPGSRSPVSYIDTTRSAETLSVPLPKGAYIERIEDGVNTVSTAFLLSTSSYRALTNPSWIPWITRYRLYSADAYDVMDRANTSDGSIGVASDGGTYTLFNGYVASYPLPTATTGRITSNWVTITPVAGSTGVIYAVRDLGGPVRYASLRVRFGAAVSGGGALSNTAVALLLSNNLTNFVEVMPVHLVLTRSGLSVQKRVANVAFIGSISGNTLTVSAMSSGTIVPGLSISQGGVSYNIRANGTGSGGTGTYTLDTSSTVASTSFSGSFVTIGFIGAKLSPNNSEHIISFAISGTTMTVTLNNQGVVVSDPAIADSARYACAEIICTSNNTTDNAQFKDFFAAKAIVGDVPAFVAAAPVVTAAAYPSPSSPASYTSGCTLSVNPAPADVNSNSGMFVITGYQWYRNGSPIGGATSSSYVTTAGTDAGAVFYCAISFTNNSGTTVGNSLSTTALL